VSRHLPKSSPARGCAVRARGCRAARGRRGTIAVPAGSSLQSALNAAQPGDVITLEPGATYAGNFVLPNKGDISDFITIRSAAPDSALPSPGLRMTPAYSTLLPKIRSSNTSAALKTAASANHWKLMFLEFLANQSGAGDWTRTDLAQVPHDLVLARLYIHGDPVLGQKRGVSLNSRDTWIINSHISTASTDRVTRRAWRRFSPTCRTAW